MNEIEFDKALSDFLDDEECEKVNEAVYGLIRSAFTAGWKAAMGSDIGKLMKLEGRQAEFFKDSLHENLGCDLPL